MGAGTSALPDYLNEQDIERISEGKFDKSVFEKLDKDHNGCITRMQFLQAVDAKCEIDAYNKIIEYCPDGNIDSRAFIRMCKDANILDGKAFPRSMADVIYKRAQTIAKSATNSPLISYNIFRSNIVPGIASRKHVHEMSILLQIARADGPKWENVTQTKPTPLYDDLLYLSNADDIDQSRIPSNHSHSCNDNNSPDPPISFDREPLKPLFINFSYHGKMTSLHLQKLIKEKQLFDSRSGYSEDIDLIFTKIKSKMSNNNNNKTKRNNNSKVNFDMFCDYVIPELSRRRAEPIQDTIDYLLLDDYSRSARSRSDSFQPPPLRKVNTPSTTSGTNSARRSSGIAIQSTNTPQSALQHDCSQHLSGVCSGNRRGQLRTMSSVSSQGNPILPQTSSSLNQFEYFCVPCAPEEGSIDTLKNGPAVTRLNGQEIKGGSEETITSVSFGYDINSSNNNSISIMGSQAIKPNESDVFIMKYEESSNQIVDDDISFDRSERSVSIRSPLLTGASTASILHNASESNHSSLSYLSQPNINRVTATSAIPNAKVKPPASTRGVGMSKKPASLINKFIVESSFDDWAAAFDKIS